MPRKTQTASSDKGVGEAPAKRRGRPAKATKELDPEVVLPVRHSTVDPDNDPEAEPVKVSTISSLNRPYFKGFPILKAYHGRQLKYFVKMADGMTCFMFQPGGDEEAMFKILISQPKVATMVPLGIGEKRGQAIQHVQLNGLRMNVIKGRVVQLPANVAEVLANSQADTAEALANVETVSPFDGEVRNANLAYRDERELQSLTR